MFLRLFAILFFVSSVSSYGQEVMNRYVIELSQDLIYAARGGGETQSFVDELAVLGETTFEQQLQTDDEKKAFFINLYNAYVQVLLKRDPGQYKSRHAFFTKKQIVIAGNELSLDDLEHGILRHSRTKWSLGYVGKIFPGSFEKKMRVKKIDYRIHFALNCGAKSCPAIAYYKPGMLDEQLDLATRTYLQQEAVYDEQRNVLKLPALMSWFRADLGGKNKILGLCAKLQIIPLNAHPHISYKKYDWNLYLNNYKRS